MGALVKKEVQAAVANPEQGQCLTLLLGGEIFAIGILSIKEIIEDCNLTEVPRMPDFIRGVISLRGATLDRASARHPAASRTASASSSSKCSTRANSRWWA